MFCKGLHTKEVNSTSKFELVGLFTLFLLSSTLFVVQTAIGFSLNQLDVNDGGAEVSIHQSVDFQTISCDSTNFPFSVQCPSELFKENESNESNDESPIDDAIELSNVEIVNFDVTKTILLNSELSLQSRRLIPLFMLFSSWKSFIS